MGQETNRKIVFLSHASEDRDLAAAIQTSIEEAFPDAFHIFNAFRGNSIALSDEWRPALRRAVGESSLFLVLLTRNSITKPWIYWETGGAYHRSIPIIPVVGPGCDVRNLPEQLREIEAVSVHEQGGLRRLLDRLAQLAGMTHLSEQHDLSMAVKRITDFSGRLAGTSWGAMTKDALMRYLSNPFGEAQLEVRIVSYTSETIATSIPRQIDQYYDGATPLRLRILIRSEYDRFALRPNESEFNRRIRWKISRAKADWYRWLHECTAKSSRSDGLIDLQIRNYWWDPSVRALLLGRSEGFFGLYGMMFAPPLGSRTETPRAVNWVARDTAMAPLSQELVNDFVEWFDHVWEESTVRTNEAYRCEVSETLLQLAHRKGQSDPTAVSAINRWRANRSRTPVWEIGSLALPARYPEDATALVDFRGCAVVVKGVSGAILVSDIRQRGATWGGIGKTSTYLELTGMHPYVSRDGQAVKCNSLDEALRLLRRKADVEWDVQQRNPRVSLFATDFVWLYDRDGVLRIIKPEGEVLWGLWDSARYVLRRLLTETAWVEDIQRTEAGRLIQKKVFAKLPIEPLCHCYTAGLETELAAVFILCPDTNDEFCVNEIANPDAARRLLVDAVRSAPHHPSPFWRRTDREIQHHNDVARQIVDAVHSDRLPRVFSIRHRLPFESVAGIILAALDEGVPTGR